MPWPFFSPKPPALTSIWVRRKSAINPEIASINVELTPYFLRFVPRFFCKILTANAPTFRLAPKFWGPFSAQFPLLKEGPGLNLTPNFFKKIPKRKGRTRWPPMQQRDAQHKFLGRTATVQPSTRGRKSLAIWAATSPATLTTHAPLIKGVEVHPLEA